MTATLPPAHALPTAPMGMRALSPTDTEALARLMLDAYAGTIDDSGNETIETARAEVQRLMRGDYGALDSVSRVVERDGTLASATIVTHHRGAPFIAFSMTAPSWKRQGLARSGLLHVMHALASRRERQLHLVVTKGNTPAENLYVALGFTPGSPPAA